jgi:predicted TIM-barrel enzyme
MYLTAALNFASRKPVIGMIHLDALPGTPASRLAAREIEATALAEAHLYRAAGIHGVMIENMHDTASLRGAVGSHFKVDGVGSNALDAKRAERFLAAHARLGG